MRKPKWLDRALFRWRCWRLRRKRYRWVTMHAEYGGLVSAEDARREFCAQSPEHAAAYEEAKAKIEAELEEAR